MKEENNIIFQKDGAIFSHSFNDIYFDSQTGYQQSEQVFIKSNNLAERLLNSQNNVTIAELGFGTGLNFLLSLRCYVETLNIAEAQNKPLVDLHYISVEKFPLSQSQLNAALSLFADLTEYKNLLVAQYPAQPVTETTPITLSFLNGKVQLSLYFCPADKAINAIKKQKNGVVDIWYLDGFSPRKNPDMWTLPLFEQIAKLSKEQASLSTFTVAGFVRRQLKQVGFRLTKKALTVDKKECMVGIFQQNPYTGKGYQLRPQVTKPMHVTIIGGGIASACAAYTLTKHGIKVNLICQEELAQGASSNTIGALFPLLHQQQDDISLFYQRAFYRARELYDELLAQGFEFAHSWCGLLEIAYKPALQKRQQVFAELAAWPDDLITSINAEQASAKANIALKHGGLLIPKSGWICPPELVNALLNAAKKTNRLTIETGIKVTEIQRYQKQSENDHPENKWLLTTNKGEQIASTLIICGGAESIKLNIVEQLPIYPVRGQVSNMKANNLLAQLTTVICHKGYLTPAYQNVQCIGATFDKNTFDTEYRSKDDDFNLNMLEECLPDLALWQKSDIETSKARLRAMTPDHLPMVGVMPNIEKQQQQYSHLAKDKNWRYAEPAANIDDLYLFTGLGARGLCSAPLLADILLADLTGLPYPVDNQMLFNLAPNRFVIRDLIKRKN